MVDQRYAYKILVGKPEGKRHLGRPRRRWVDNIKIDPIEIKLDCVDWIDMAQDRDQWRTLVKRVLNPILEWLHNSSPQEWHSSVSK
jgi:hypothetical protein